MPAGPVTVVCLPGHVGQGTVEIKRSVDGCTTGVDWPGLDSVISTVVWTRVVVVIRVVTVLCPLVVGGGRTIVELLDSGGGMTLLCVVIVMVFAEEV